MLRAAPVSDATATPTPEQTTPWKRPAPLSPKAIGVLVGLALLMNLPLIHFYLLRSRPDATAALPYRDDFSGYSDPNKLRERWFSTGGHYRTVGGELLSPGVKNNPLWLKAKLPQNVAVEFDARSLSPEGDIKAEIFGNGTDHASGYVLIHGGWNNSISIIARLDEHGVPLQQLQRDPEWKTKFAADTRMRVEGQPFPVTIGKPEHWRIERRGSLISWFINGQKFLEFDDPKPLVGPDHDRFGFSSWEGQLYFDNLSVEAL